MVPRQASETRRVDFPRVRGLEMWVAVVEEEDAARVVGAERLVGDFDINVVGAKAVVAWVEKVAAAMAPMPRDFARDLRGWVIFKAGEDKSFAMAVIFFEIQDVL